MCNLRIISLFLNKNICCKVSLELAYSVMALFEDHSIHFSGKIRKTVCHLSQLLLLVFFLSEALVSLLN